MQKLHHQSEHRQNPFARMLHYWGIPAAVGLLLVFLWAVIIVMSTSTKQRQLEDSRKELTQLNIAVAQHAASLFRDVETDLRVIDHWLQANPGIDPRSDARFGAMVAELRRTSKGMVDPRMVTADGKLFYIPTPDGKPLADVSDRSYFTVPLNAAERQLHIGDPVQSRVTKKWGIPISLRLEAPVSGIAVIFANIDLAELDSLHEQMRLKSDASIALIRTDGIVLSRTPVETGWIGRNVKSSPGFRDEYGVKQRGTFISDGKNSDRVIRLISYERLADYPITVLVNRGLDGMLDEYQRRRGMVLAGATALTILAIALVLVVRRSQSRLQATQDQLQRLEATDSLTGTMSRRAFLEAAQRESNRARRYTRPAAVLMLDIDHFKKVNDTHGHAMGDTVLRGCTLAWLALLREQDFLGRIGGEEFCAVLPETPVESAKRAAERLRKAVGDLEFKGTSGEFAVTVSIGIAMVLQTDADFAKTMERADRALYLAKERGRNRIDVLDDNGPIESA